MKRITRKYTPALIVTGLFIIISFLTRLGLLLFAAKGFDWTFGNVLGAFGIGLLYDVATASYLFIPFVLQIWLSNDFFYTGKRKWISAVISISIVLLLVFTNIIPKDFNGDLHRAIVYYALFRCTVFVLLVNTNFNFRQRWRTAILNIDLFFFTFIFLFNAASEWFFWDEFSSRYNFIAVDYLVYTNEVIGNIQESYPIVWIVIIILLLTTGIFLLLRKYIKASVNAEQSFKQKTIAGIALLLLPTASLLFMKDNYKHFSKNTYANELAGNGVFDFVVAFKANELDFFRYYKTLPDKEAFEIVRQQLSTPNSRFTSDDVFNIEREISYGEPEKKMNVVLISVESLSGNFMEAFGNKQHITPQLDSLAQYSLFFTNLYAAGTRTVRGLEALSLAIPPSAGQSIVKREQNSNMFSLGSVFQSKGYATDYIYGGYGYFDNMNAFFGNNGYTVVDRTALSPSDIHYSNIWGVADEDLFTLATRQLDQHYAAGKPFFAHVMTVSNHRPYTYPDGRIDISPATQSREGAVKYTDYAIGKFLKDAQHKPWFNNTIFVIVADHCASSAGSVELPVTGYHIPMLIYSPANIQPKKIEQLTSQIDVAPTILGLLKFHYKSKFLGQDIFTTPAGQERAFISTYQGLGYIKDGKLVIQSPLKQVRTYQPDFVTGKAVEVKVSDDIINQAIAFYQTTAWLIKHHQYTK